MLGVKLYSEGAASDEIVCKYRVIHSGEQYGLWRTGRIRMLCTELNTAVSSQSV